MEFDSGLIARAQAGEVAAQEDLIKRFSPMVFRLVSRFFRQREDVEDLAQVVFMKMFDRLDQVRPEENFPGWLTRVAVNACYDELRKIRRRKVALETFGPQKSGEPSVLPVEPEFFSEVRSAVESLDTKLRMPFVLREVEEMSVSEIARAMGITQTNVKVRLFRARKKLAASLNEEAAKRRKA